MKFLKYFLGLILTLVFITGCKKDTFDDVSLVETGASPDQLSALFEITQDNTGLVTITPNSTGAVSYDIYYGDATTTPAKISAGKNTRG